MSKEFITNLLFLFTGVAIIIVFYNKILRKQKEQELIRLINDMSYEISKPNFNGTNYSFSLNGKHMLIPLNKEEITEYRERIWNFKSYSNYIISVVPKKDAKCIILTGVYGTFKYVKSIGMP